MPIFDVTEIKTITLTHRIKADNKKDAIARMTHKDSSKGQLFLNIMEDDCEVEYEVEEVEK